MHRCRRLGILLLQGEGCTCTAQRAAGPGRQPCLRPAVSREYNSHDYLSHVNRSHGHMGSATLFPSSGCGVRHVFCGSDVQDHLTSRKARLTKRRALDIQRARTANWAPWPLGVGTGLVPGLRGMMGEDPGCTAGVQAEREGRTGRCFWIHDVEARRRPRSGAELSSQRRKCGISGVLHSGQLADDILFQAQSARLHNAFQGRSRVRCLPPRTLLSVRG